MTPEEEKKLKKDIEGIKRISTVIMFILPGMVIMLAMMPTILR
jgi:hypothetical protein